MSQTSRSRAHRPRRGRADGRGDPGRAARREERRRELLEAAIRAIRRHGADASMEAMAAEAGVTKPILYRHFGDREGLVHAIGLQFIERFDAAVLGRLQTETEPEDLIRSTIDGYLELVEDDTELYRFLVRTVVSGDPGGTEVLGAFLTEISARIAVVISEHLAARGHDTGMAEPWAWAFVGAVHHAGDWWLERRTITRARLIDHLMALLWVGAGSYSGPVAED